MFIKLLVNSSIILGSLFILFKASMYDINWMNYESPIEYSNYDLISLKDFKGINRDNNTLDGMKDFAFIVTDIKTFKQGNKYHVISYFHPSRSYTFKKEFENDNKLLSHEIYHFHIAEYCARLLRKEIINMKPFKEESISNLKNNIQLIENSMQQSYDDESYHGYVLNKQLSWQTKVDSLLFSLKQYTETEINIIN
jgi:hypothetical protein